MEKLEKYINYRWIGAGVLLGIIAAVFGSILQAILFGLETGFRYSPFDNVIPGIIIAFLPAVAGGGLLAVLLYKDYLEENLKTVRSIVTGLIVGILVSAAEGSVLVLMIADHWGFGILPYRLVVFVAIAGLMSGLAGIALAKIGPHVETKA